MSQLIELAVLDDIDHFIKERLRIRYFIRYMDDFILIHSERAVLERALEEIRTRIEALYEELKEGIRSEGEGDDRAAAGEGRGAG